MHRIGLKVGLYYKSGLHDKSRTPSKKGVPGIHLRPGTPLGYV